MTETRTAVTALATVLLLSACEEPLYPPPDPVDGQVLSAAAAEDVEALIGGSLAGWWRAAHGFGPSAALSTAADAHTSSWRNWGMLNAGQEPRMPLAAWDDLHKEYVGEVPWKEIYRSLVAARDGLIPLTEGLELGQDGADTRRAFAWGRFVQGVALGTLAQLFPEAWILDDTTDPSVVQLSSHQDVMAAALAKLDEAVALSEGGTFVVPAGWAAFDRPLDQDELARLARSYRARLRISGARTAAERAAVDWAAVLDDARNGLQQDWAGYHSGAWETNWAWDLGKLFTATHPAWARMDYRTIGPADASGAWESWIAQSPSQRRPFPIDTDDRRITGATPTAAGAYMRYVEQIHFLPSRGLDHFSYYVDTRFSHLLDDDGVGRYVDFPVKELEFLEAEALYRLGDRQGAMAVVNGSRSIGGLPLFTDPDGQAPGGDRCVPQTPDGSCGDLWEALKYEKRIELFHYGPFTEYLDDRGWGDLVQGTFRELDRPDVSLGDLLAEFYDASSPEVATTLANGRSEEDLDRKRKGIEHFDQSQNRHPGDVGAG